MPDIIETVQRIIDRITMGLNVLGTLLIVALMILINSDVIGRQVFLSPISGVPEMVSLSIVAIVFLQVGQAFRMFVADNGSDWFVSGAPHEGWDDDELRALRSVKGADFEAVYTGPVLGN